VSTFWIVLANHLRGMSCMLIGCRKVDGSSLVCSILIITSRVDIACHTTSLYPY
jgi:hypothetical protein